MLRLPSCLGQLCEFSSCSEGRAESCTPGRRENHIDLAAKTVAMAGTVGKLIALPTTNYFSIRYKTLDARGNRQHLHGVDGACAGSSNHLKRAGDRLRARKLDWAGTLTDEFTAEEFLHGCFVGFVIQSASHNGAWPDRVCVLARAIDSGSQRWTAEPSCEEHGTMAGGAACRERWYTFCVS